MQTTKEFSIARLQAAKHWPFAASAILSTVCIESTSVKLVEVDRHWRIYVNPEAFKAISPAARVTEILRATNQLLRFQYKRFRNIVGFDPAENAQAVLPSVQEQWSTACQLEINDDFISEDLEFAEDPEDPADYGFDFGQTAETYFSLLQEQQQESSQQERGDSQQSAGDESQSDQKQRVSEADGHPCPSDNDCVNEAESDVTWGEVFGGKILGQPENSASSQDQCGDTEREDAAGSSASDGVQRSWEQPGDSAEVPAIPEREQQFIANQVAQKIVESESIGNVPAFLRKWAEARLNPEIDYVKLINRKIRYAVEHTHGSTDYTFRKVSRRDLGLGDRYALPAMHAPSPRVVIIVDTSGSVSSDETSRFLTEIGGALKGLQKRDGIQVICADSDVKAVQRVTRAQDLDVVGGGGTSMEKAIIEAAKGRPRPQLIIVFTDGITPWPAKSVGVQTLAVLSRKKRLNSVPSWIETVLLSSAEKH